MENMAVRSGRKKCGYALVEKMKVHPGGKHEL
jgi:hypothetical protein